MMFGPKQVKHGTRSAYINWGCRCNDCGKSAVAYTRQWREDSPAQKRIHDILKTVRLYGLTLIGYLSLHHLQESKCAVCGQAKKLTIDHNHETGAVRGLLCMRCNVLLGYLGDTVKEVNFNASKFHSYVGTI